MQNPPCSILMLGTGLKLTHCVPQGGSLIAPHEIKLCDECYHHSALRVISLCHICSFKVQIWDPVVVGPRSNGPLVIGLCPSYPLFKTQLKCSSPLFSVNEESVSDRKWSLTSKFGAQRWTGYCSLLEELTWLRRQDEQLPMSVPGIFLALAIFSGVWRLEDGLISFGSSCD